MDLEQKGWHERDAISPAPSVPFSRNFSLTPLPAFPGAAPQSKHPFGYAQAGPLGMPQTAGAAYAQRGPQAGAAPQAYAAAQHSNQVAALGLLGAGVPPGTPDASPFTSRPVPWVGATSAPSLHNGQQLQSSAAQHVLQQPVMHPAPDYTTYGRTLSSGFFSVAPASQGAQNGVMPTARVQPAQHPHAQHPHMQVPAHALPQPADTPADAYAQSAPGSGEEPPPPGAAAPLQGAVADAGLAPSLAGASLIAADTNGGAHSNAAQHVKSGSGGTGSWHDDSGQEGDHSDDMGEGHAAVEAHKPEGQPAVAVKTEVHFSFLRLLLS